MKPLYRFGKFLLAFFSLFAGWKIIGRENVPPEEAMLIVANHSSYGDPALLAAVFPYQICFVAKEMFSQKIFTKKLFSFLGAVFLNKDESDLTAMRTVIGVLKLNKAVAIFPEGHRNRNQQIGEFKQGAAFIAYRTGVKIIPVAISNSRDFFRFWRHNIVVNIGMPIEMAIGSKGSKASAEALAECSKLCQQKIIALQEENIAVLAKNNAKNFAP